MRKTAFFLALTALALSVACNRAPPPVAATPSPTAAELAQRRAQDSVVAARRASADSVERARVAALAVQARADSIERVRLAAATTAREAAAKQNATLREELGVMVHFDVARAELQPDGRAALDRKVAILKANPNVRVRITGACDVRGSDAYNQALGKRRAAAVMRYLVAGGVDATRLEVASVGEASPIDVGSGEAAWARNRRAQFLIVSGESLLAMK
jgi:peptidoglycan-associated lipoprotein